jgi:hypothetical protein
VLKPDKEWSMEAISLTELATGLLNDARNHHSGRAAHTLHGGSAQSITARVS